MLIKASTLNNFPKNFSWQQTLKRCLSTEAQSTFGHVLTIGSACTINIINLDKMITGCGGSSFTVQNMSNAVTHLRCHHKDKDNHGCMQMHK